MRKSLVESLLTQKVSVELKIEYWIALLWLAHPDCTDCQISDEAAENVLPEIVKQLVDVYLFAAENGYLNFEEIKVILATKQVRDYLQLKPEAGEAATNWEG